MSGGFDQELFFPTLSNLGRTLLSVHNERCIEMANATVTRIGSINNAVATKDEIEALFLKLFSGEVLTSFEQTTVAADRVMKRTITSGKALAAVKPL